MTSKNRSGHEGMNRRSFLKIATVAALGRRATARVLLLLNADENAPLAKVEWMVYDTGRRDGSRASEHRCVVRIWTTTGVQGWAETSATAMPDNSTAASIREALIGRNVSQHDAIWRTLYQQGLPLGTLAAVDIALWDLRGRIADKPVHALLGTQRQKARTYASTPFNLGEPDKYAQYALACKEKGLHGCKVHPYIEWGASRDGLPHGGFPDKDMAAYRAVRDAVGSEFPCMADNYCTYVYDDALRVGRLLDELQYDWYESPMPESDAWRERYTRLSGELRTPVCAPETHPDSYPARVLWVTAKACDIARIDAGLGGFTACLELAGACEAAGIPLELHDLGPDSYPHRQLIGATSESLIQYVEIQDLAPVPGSVRPGRATPEPVFDSEGCVAIPQTPGMGLELDWRYIYTHRVS